MPVPPKRQRIKSAGPRRPSSRGRSTGVDQLAASAQAGGQADGGGGVGQLQRRMLYACRVLDWPAHGHFPVGVAERLLGPVGDTLAESEAILVQHGVASEEWSEEVLASVPDKEGWRVPEEIAPCFLVFVFLF